jgi:ABC-type transport system involved in multi-copper enzyme maturation permease subunit
VAPRHVALAPLLRKELREITTGRALWTMLLLLCPLVGYSFFQAVALYGEASASARDSPVLASGLSPLDGVLVPSFGALYLGVTLLFPFVAIRALGHEKETGALRLLVQLPYRMPSLIAAKLGAISLAWIIASLPALTVLAIWAALGGHLYAPEILNLFLGHLLYGLLVGSIGLFAAAVSDSAATAAIIALAFTIGSWILDFALAGQPGLLDVLSRLSLTHTVRSFEQGLLSIGLLVGITAAIVGFAALATVWLHPGQQLLTKLIRSLIAVAVTAGALALSGQIRTSIDVAEDRRNSFPVADQRALAELRQPLIITVHLVPEDPRYVDLRRNVLSKLQRAVPDVTVRLAVAAQTMVGGTSDVAYGDVESFYNGSSARSRSTSHREALPLIYGLAGKPIPTPVPGQDYRGYPLEAFGAVPLAWFFGALPLLVVVAWWWSGRAPRIPGYLS